MSPLRVLPLRLVLGSALLAIASCAMDSETEPVTRAPLAKADLAGSCVGRCGSIAATGDCHCDALCAEYGDCCADVDEACSAPESPGCPAIDPPPVNACPDGGETEIVTDAATGCAIGYTCSQPGDCESHGGTCVPASSGCPPFTSPAAHGCGDFDRACCTHS